MTTLELTMRLVDRWVSGQWAVEVYRDSGIPRLIGELKWSKADGIVDWIEVHQDFRRQGLATRMWHEANRQAETGACVFPRHSTSRTLDGHGWIMSVGGACEPGTLDLC